jgi:hypothetical protein
MKTYYQIDGPQTSLIVTDLDPVYQQAVRDLGYTEFPAGFGRTYPSDTPHLAQIYEHFARSVEPMLQQTAGLRAVPWEQALHTFLQRIEGLSLNWWLAGSAALAVRGIAVQPRDFDLIVDQHTALVLGEHLRDILVEPVHPVKGWFCAWWGRAFQHARFEWVGDVYAFIDEPEPSDFGPYAAQHLETLEWRGYPIRVPPLELQHRVSIRRGLHERAALIQQHIEQQKHKGTE